VPIPAALRGCVTVHPFGITREAFALDGAGRHRWWPIAPAARVEVAFTHPALSWSGRGYLDANAGDAPLERDLRLWTWSRAGLSDGTAILYDVEGRDGYRTSLARRFDARGDSEAIAPPPRAALPHTAWRLARATRADGRPRVLRTLEDTPFYARSVIEAQVAGETGTAMHESLDLDRFRARWVQLLLPFRAPRMPR